MLSLGAEREEVAHCPEKRVERMMTRLLPGRVEVGKGAKGTPKQGWIHVEGPGNLQP